MNKYFSLNRFSESISIPADDLVEAFEIESPFHQKILESESEIRTICNKNI